jgi:hypothetical protein
MHVKLYILKGNNHAFAAENYVRILKNRLYKAVRSKFSDKWPTILQSICSDINFTENKGISGLVPAEVNSPISDPVVREARAEVAQSRPKIKKTQDTFQIGQFVYIDLGKEAFTKGFDLARGQIFKVAGIDKSSEPYFYTIHELDETPIRKKYYSWQLRKAPDPDKTQFAVEKVLETRNKGKQKEYLVKFLFYPDKYNLWIKQRDFIG